MIDGLQFDLKCTITRTIEVQPSDISGILLDRSYFNDVIGTYLKYDISIEVPPYHQDTYAEFLDVLSDPVDGHSFILPYDQGEITITGRIEAISDEYVKLPGGKKFWKGTTFSIIANHPSKEMSLEQVLARGRKPLPEISEVQRGDIYTYTSSGWVKTIFTNADEVYY